MILQDPPYEIRHGTLSLQALATIKYLALIDLLHFYSSINLGFQVSARGS